MSKPHPYIIVSDNDCHRYVIPREKKEDWDAWREIDSDDERAWGAPEYADPVGGSPDRVTFYLDGTYTIG